MTVSAFVYGLVSSDPTLNTYGFNADNIYGYGAPDSPSARRFIVLAWGVTLPGIAGQRGSARMSQRECSVWVYDKDPDYTVINQVLRRCQDLFAPLLGVKTGSEPGDGWIADASWAGDQADSYDDVYECYTRYGTYTIMASGD